MPILTRALRRAVSGWAQGWSGQCAATRQRLLLANIPDDLIHVRGGLISARPRSVIALPVLYEGQVKAVIELASVQEFTALASGVPRAAHRQYRRRAEHHRSDHAHRDAARTIAATRGRAAIAAERAAADQRGTRDQGEAARGTERRGGAQEPGDRSGATRTGRESDRARGDVAVQVRVPREHVARAAHAAEQHSRARPAARRKRRRQRCCRNTSNSARRFTPPVPICST